jgi:hypothetical protein
MTAHERAAKLREEIVRILKNPVFDEDGAAHCIETACRWALCGAMTDGAEKERARCERLLPEHAAVIHDWKPEWDEQGRPI